MSNFDSRFGILFSLIYCSLNKLSLFQKSDNKFSRKCPLSIKNAPIVDYKNISLLKKYMYDVEKLDLAVQYIELIQEKILVIW